MTLIKNQAFSFHILRAYIAIFLSLITINVLKKFVLDLF